MERLGTEHLAELAVGIDPYSKQEPTATQAAKKKMLLSHLNEAYLRAAGWAFEAAQRIASDEVAMSEVRRELIPIGIPVDGQSPVPGKWASLSTHAGKIGLLPTEDLTLAFENAFWDRYIDETLERIHACGEMLPVDAMFERDAIYDWLNFLGWKSEYEFAPWRNTTGVETTSTARHEATHPRTEKNYVALIAAMAIDKYGYQPDAARSPVAGDLSALLRAKGFSLTDEAIRGYLKEGAGHLNAKKRQ